MTRSQEISALATLAILALLAVLLCVCRLSWNPAQPWPPEPSPYIVAQAEEFIEPELLPDPPVAGDAADAPALTEEHMDVPSESAPESGTALRDKGPVAPPQRETPANRPSTVKKTPEPKVDKSGAAAENARKAREAEARRTNSAVSNAFKKTEARNNANNRQGDTGRSGSPAGNAKSAGPANSASRTPGVRHGKLGGGWQWPSYSVSIRTPKTGSIILSLTIDSNGKVTEARPTGGSAPASSDPALIDQCQRIARSRTFTRPAGSPAPEKAMATITFTFE